MTSTGPLLDADGAAELLNVPASWVLAQARADRIPHVRLGRYVRFDADELCEWWKARSRGGSSAPTVKEHLLSTTQDSRPPRKEPA